MGRIGAVDILLKKTGLMTIDVKTLIPYPE
jgi:hypothetical protein